MENKVKTLARLMACFRPQTSPLRGQWFEVGGTGEGAFPSKTAERQRGITKAEASPLSNTQEITKTS